MDSSVYIIQYIFTYDDLYNQIMHEDVYDFLLFAYGLPKSGNKYLPIGTKRNENKLLQLYRIIENLPVLVQTVNTKNLIWTNNKLSIETLKAHKLSKIICCLLMTLSLNCRYTARMLSNIKAYAHVVVIIVMMLNQFLGHNISNLQFSNSQPYYTSIVSIGPWQ